MDLIQELEERTTRKGSGRVNKAEYDVWDIPGLMITRWKFQEFDYYNQRRAQMPIPARGLFTLDDRILLRGYNKFFNLGEVAELKPDQLKPGANDMQGPFYATVKENGYLTLIGGYGHKLVVTSKNAAGPKSTHEGRNYSKVARDWVLRHLESAGRTEAELADYLETHNLTAVGEVCDDSFEEHVLPYPPSEAGIYLNGLNHNTREFRTESPAVVNEIGAKFGFRKTDFVEFATYAELMEFLEQGQASGKWGSRDVEGWVVRCKRPNLVAAAAAEAPEGSQTESSQAAKAVSQAAKAVSQAAEAMTLGEPPSANIGDYFFKFKFEEPYLMYRAWREVVKTSLREGQVAGFRRARRSKHRESASRFLQFAWTYLASRPELRERIEHHNLGIIELREQFFASEHTDEAALLSLASSIPKYLLVTVATLGCGKSTVGDALHRLVGWGHRQNDDGHGKGRKFARLSEAVLDDFVGLDVVMLDRNNVAKSERDEIVAHFDSVGDEVGYDVTYIGLNFLPNGPTLQSSQLTRARVKERGDGHSTVRVSELGERKIEGIMSQFEKRFQPLTEFEHVVELEPGESEANVAKVLAYMRQFVEVPEFSPAQIAEAVKQTREAERTAVRPPLKLSQAKASGKAQVKASGKDQGKAPRWNYFGVQIPKEQRAQLMKLIDQKVPAEFRANKEWRPFHVTLAHRRSHAAEFAQLTTQHAAKLGADGAVPRFVGAKKDVAVVELAWSAEAVAFRVEVEGGANKEVSHITAGLAKNVAAKDARKVLEGAGQRVKIERVELRGLEVYAAL